MVGGFYGDTIKNHQAVVVVVCCCLSSGGAGSAME